MIDGTIFVYELLINCLYQVKISIQVGHFPYKVFLKNKKKEKSILLTYFCSITPCYNCHSDHLTTEWKEFSCLGFYIDLALNNAWIHSVNKSGFLLKEQLYCDVVSLSYKFLALSYVPKLIKWSKVKLTLISQWFL